MTIRSKVTIALIIVMFSLAILLFISQYITSKIQAATELYIPAAEEIVYLNDLSIQIGLFENNVDKYLIIKSDEYKALYKEELAGMRQIVARQRDNENYQGDFADIQEIKSTLDAVGLLLQRFDEVSVVYMDPQELNRLTVSVYEKIGQLRDLNSEHIVKDLEKFSQIVREQETLTERLTQWLTLTALGILLVIIGVSLFWLHEIVNPIVALRNGVESITRGDLKARLNIVSKDEIGELASAFNTMVEKIDDAQQNLEEKVEVRTKELKTTATELQEKVDELEKFQRLTVGRELKMIELKKEIEALKAKGDEHTNRNV